MKSKLSLEALSVESFVTGTGGAIRVRGDGPTNNCDTRLTICTVPPMDLRGTVRANQEDYVEPFGKPTDATCPNTCSCWTWYDASCPPDTVCIG